MRLINSIILYSLFSSHGKHILLLINLLGFVEALSQDLSVLCS